VSKFRKHEYDKRQKNDGFKKMKDPSGKRRDRKKMKDYEIEYNNAD
jgi:hypothetical protein